MAWRTYPIDTALVVLTVILIVALGALALDPSSAAVLAAFGGI